MNRKSILKLAILVFSYIACVQLSLAQEVVTDLNINPRLTSIWKNVSTKKLNQQKVLSISDTLELPFTDDFTINSSYPNQQLWLDSNVFINDDYPINALSYGVATFDGLDKYGFPYNSFNPTAHGMADSLTSKPLNLYFPSDSIFLSFYYQAKGLGNTPEPDDSLMLQFRGPSTAWKTVYTLQQPSGNSPDTVFNQVIIAITDSAYRVKGFQFRFINYATLSGGVDHWHIDYVRVLKGLRSMTNGIEESAIQHRTKSMLNSYQAMPWGHFTSAMMNNQLTLYMRNNSTVNLPRNTGYKLSFYDNNGILLDATSTTQHLPNPNSKLAVAKSFSYVYDRKAQDPDNVVFEVRNVISSSGDSNTKNDTSRYFQRFNNCFAYDDGAAENGYGLAALGAKLAVRFTLTHPDSLRAVDMSFPLLLNNQSQKTFKLVVWSSISPTETILYMSDKSVSPQYLHFYNGFYRYHLPNPLPVSGTIYIGWIQNTDEILNIGLDRNVDNKANTFYNVSQSWSQSSIKGAIMIRPIVGKAVSLVGIDNTIAIIDNDVTLYPNPAADQLMVRMNIDVLPENITYQLIDRVGKVVQTGKTLPESIDVAHLQQGLYLLKLQVAGRSIIKKFTVIH